MEKPSIKLKFEDLFSVGDTIRGYDYNPDLVEQREVFAQGSVVEIVSFPFKAYRILCSRCTGSGREGRHVDIPMEISVAEFDGRIVIAE